MKIKFYEEIISEEMDSSELLMRNETEKITLANNILLQKILEKLNSKEKNE